MLARWVGIDDLPVFAMPLTFAVAEAERPGWPQSLPSPAPQAVQPSQGVNGSIFVMAPSSLVGTASGGIRPSSGRSTGYWVEWRVRDTGRLLRSSAGRGRGPHDCRYRRVEESRPVHQTHSACVVTLGFRSRDLPLETRLQASGERSQVRGTGARGPTCTARERGLRGGLAHLMSLLGLRVGRAPRARSHLRLRAAPDGRDRVHLHEFQQDPG